MWKEILHEIQIYQILHKIQESAVPVFLETIDLAKIYFLYSAGQIHYIFVIDWDGKSTDTIELILYLRREIHRSKKEVKTLDIIYKDLKPDNVFWCKELGYTLIIDFHCSTLRCRPATQRLGPGKRQLCQVDTGHTKRLKIS